MVIESIHNDQGKGSARVLEPAFFEFRSPSSFEGNGCHDITCVLVALSTEEKMTVIDVRASKSFTYVQPTNASTKLRFRVTDDYYLTFTAAVKDHNARQVVVDLRITPDSRTLWSYDVILSHEQASGGKGFATFSPDVWEMPITTIARRRRGGDYRGILIAKGKESKIVLTFRYHHKSTRMPESLHEDIMSLFSAQDVTLTASDGDVKANLNLLTTRSPVFRAMFGRETWEEVQTKTVDMTRFTKEVLEAFVGFLLNEKLVNPKKTASALLELGHKYNIPSLETASKNFILENRNEDNIRLIYKQFQNVCPELVEESFVNTYGKRKKDSP